MRAIAWAVVLIVLAAPPLRSVPDNRAEPPQSADAGPAGETPREGGRIEDGDWKKTERIMGGLEELKQFARQASPDQVEQKGSELLSLARSLHPDAAGSFVDSYLMPQVLEIYARARERGPASVRPSSSRHVTDLTEGLIREGKRLRPARPESFLRGGRFYAAAKDYDRAFEDYGRAIALGLKTPETLTGYGNAAYHLGDAPLAARSARQALEADPSDRAALALWKLSEGRVPQVELPDVLDGAEKPSGGAGLAAPAPGAPAALSPAEVAAAAQRQAHALPTAVEQSAALTAQAASAMSMKDYTEARELATRAISINPRNAQAWNHRAIAGSKMGRYSEAVYDASFALGLDPGNAAALQTRSWAFARTGRYREALADANCTMEKEPDNSFAYYNRAFAQAGLGDREGALVSLGKAAGLDPRFQAPYDQALQAPRDSDLLFLFDEVGGRAAVPALAREGRPKRFLRLALISVLGGVLVALGLLHIFSPRWRQTLRATVRRALGGVEAPAAAPTAEGFWSGYSVTREIGSGGMGVVYEATDNALARRVAIKKMRDEIRRDPAECRRFLAEARIVAALRHPNIVDIYSIVEDAGDIYLVFEYVDGRTVAELVKENGPFPFERARRVMREACAAVAYAHQQGVIHRDLKLSNIMLSADGRVKVMDFGVARRAQEALTKLAPTSTIAGTPPYMAPEVEQGSTRRESDIFGLGVCFYEMVSARLPFDGQGAGMLLNKINGKHVPLSRLAAGLPAGTDEVVAKALAPDPERRFRSAEDFSAALQGLQG